MSVPKPRGKPPAEPPWCVRTSHDDSQLGRHQSAEVRAGSRRGNGEAVAWLLKMGHGPTWVSLLVAHMASCTVELSLDDAAKLRDGLTVLLDKAGYSGQPRPR